MSICNCGWKDGRHTATCAYRLAFPLEGPADQFTDGGTCWLCSERQTNCYCYDEDRLERQYGRAHLPTDRDSDYVGW